MDKGKLIQFFSDFWKIDTSQIDDNLTLDNNTLEDYNSIRFYQFIAAIESNFNVKIANIHGIRTFGDLFKNIKPIE